MPPPGRTYPVPSCTHRSCGCLPTSRWRRKRRPWRPAACSERGAAGAGSAAAAPHLKPAPGGGWRRGVGTVRPRRPPRTRPHRRGTALPPRGRGARRDAEGTGRGAAPRPSRPGTPPAPASLLKERAGRTTSGTQRERLLSENTGS